MERRGFLSRILSIAVAGVVSKDLCFTPPKAAVVTGHDPFGDRYDPKGFGVVPAHVEGEVYEPKEYAMGITVQMENNQVLLNKLQQRCIELQAERIGFAPTEWGK